MKLALENIFFSEDYFKTWALQAIFLRMLKKKKKKFKQGSELIFKSRDVLSSPHLGVGLQQALGHVRVKSRKRRRTGISWYYLFT